MILTFSALQVLRWLSEQPEGDHQIPEDVCPSKYQSDIYRELVSNELLIDDARMSGGHTFQISPRSHATADRLAKRYRQAAIQLWILKSVEATPDRGAASDYFPPLDVQGASVSTAEYKRALQHLKAAELLTGIENGGGELIRPELTVRGHNALDSGYGPSDWASCESGGSSTTNYGDNHSMMISGGNIGAAQQGNANTATVTQTVGMDEVAFASAIAGLRNLLHSPQLSSETRQAASDQLDMVHEATENGGTRQRIKSMLHMFAAALPAALATDASGLVTEALASLPG